MKSSVEIEIGDQKLSVDIDYTPLVPAKVSGPPENCYPEEGGEIEVRTIKLLITPPNGISRPFNLDLTDLIEECGGAGLVQSLVEAKQEAPSDDDSHDDGDDE